MTDHHVDGNELAKALTEYVIRRDGLDPHKPHQVSITSRCDITQIGEGPAFTIHLTPSIMSPGGSS